MLQEMKKGINQWSFPAGMDLRSCFELARDAGFDGVELVVADAESSARTVSQGGAEHLALPMTYLGFYPYMNPELTLDSTAEEVEAIREMANDMGLAIPSVASVMPFIYPLTDPDPAIRERGIEIMKVCLEFSSHLGAESLLVIPGLVTPHSSYSAGLERAREGVSELLPVAESLGVVISLENVWNQFFLSPPEFRDFIDSFESRYVRAYFDVGNVVRTGIGEHWLRTLDGLVDKIHFCNYRGEVGNITGFTRHLLDGDVNWPQIIAAMKDIGYSGWVTAEITPPAPYYPEKVIYDIASTMDWILSQGHAIGVQEERIA